MEIYFASGAYGENDSVPRGTAERKRFWKESLPILEVLSEFNYPNVTHRLLETLRYLLDFSPPDETFLLIGRVVRSGRKGGYHYESLAVDLIVSLIERFIAEFGYVLQENPDCRHVLIEILDTFVEAGWASARRLTYRMEEIYR